MNDKKRSIHKTMNSNMPSELPSYIDPNIDLQRIRSECQRLVRSRARVSAGIAVIPIPFLDTVVDAGMLSIILPEITARFGLIERPEDITGSEDERHADITDRIFKFTGLIAMRGVVKNGMQGFGSRIVAKQVGKYIPLGGQIFTASMGYIIFKRVAYEHISECYLLASNIQKQSTHATPV